MSIKQAFERAGVNQRDARFSIEIARYLNSGGTFAEMRARIDAAERMSGMGQMQHAENGFTNCAQTRQPVEDVRGQCSIADGQRNAAPPSSFNRGGEGHEVDASDGRIKFALPVREPKPQRAAVDFGAASVAIKIELANSVFNRVKTSDGRAWGDVGAHELDGMSRDGALAQAIKSHIGVLTNAQRFLTVRELVNPETFEAIRSKVHGA